MKKACLDFQLTKASQSRLNGIGAVGGTNNNYLAAAFHAIHEGQHLRNDTLLNFTVGLVTLWSYGVDLIDENDGRRILLCLLKGLPQV